MEALKTPTRRPYHPAAPAKRSEWAMWVGNVPKDATEEELWDLFTGSRDHGVQSMILLSRTKCAFVNFVSEAHLAIAVERFDGKQLRPHSRRAPLVCRVRGREEDLQAGVGIQRGMGLHKEWVDAQRSHGHVDRLDSPISDASTSSSFLQTHFPQRFFVLKSHSRRELDRSVADGLWSTQSHNRGVLEQASRTAEETILFFSVNRSGEFYGYGRMRRSKAVTKSADDLPPHTNIAERSPSPVTPGPTPVPPEITQSAPSALAARTADVEEMRETGRDVPPQHSLDQLLRRPRKLEGEDVQKVSNLGEEKDEDEPSNAFLVEWICVAPLPFRYTRHIVNPWNRGREVKISRDGTELEPGAGQALLHA